MSVWLFGAILWTNAFAAGEWSFKRVTDPASVVAGDFVDHLHFTLKPDTPRLSDGARQELSHPKRFVNGQAVEFTMATKFPAFVAGHPKSLVVMQWHESMPEGVAHRRPPLAHRWRHGYLEVTLWNDEVFSKQGVHGDGLRVARLRVRPERWYQFRYRLVFDGASGAAEGEYRECASTINCLARWRPLFKHEGGFGYAEARDYYFKFGVYTTLEFSRPVVVEHVMATSDLR